LARWYGRVEGDLHEGGAFTAFVYTDSSTTWLERWEQLDPTYREKAVVRIS
jgi:hypothetical protein